ncbi:MAG TPA: alpha/beta fold hydrolase [Solirubrobacterales bacterium]|nr:alpha/beta fold hydrolase [Solirubrobacterales bacterium]
MTPIDANFPTAQTVSVHGRKVSYLKAGDGPLLLLVHGMAGTARNWEAVIEPLALHNTVIAPDFPGHGDSAPGGGDYSLGSLASGLRDLMISLGHERATLVGHSLGGGVALQFTYQFPEMVERLVLVSSGGLGPEVGMILRAAALPGADLFLRATAAPGAAAVGRVTGALGKVGLRPNADLAEVGRAYASLADADRRRAFLSTLHAVVDTDGQRVAALDRLYLAADLPILIVWGERDPIIPVTHGRAAHAQLPGSRLEVFPDAGHIPQLESPGRFAAILQRFLDETEPADFDGAEWRARFSGR